jgi:hypothetical protein
MLPQPVKRPIQQHLQDVRALHARDLEAGAGSVYLPYALERKYPHANRAWVWQYVFPAAKLSRDPRTGMVRRHHTHEQVLQRAVHGAVCQAGIAKPATCHTFRNASTYCYTSLISIDFPLLVRGGWPEIDQRGTQPDSLVLAGQGGRSRGLVTCMLASCPCGIVPSRR